VAATSFDEYIAALIDRPYERASIEREIAETFAEELAVMVLDMAGFSRVTREHGVVPYLLMIHQMRCLSMPIVRENTGSIVEAKADDLLCVFPGVADAISASREILDALDTANVVLPSRFGLYASVGIGWGMILRIGPDRVAGDQVNLAAKLGEDVADHGEILLTPEAHAALEGSGLDGQRRRTSLSSLELDYYVLSQPA
jgi:class 3 adenylate cyclase